MIDKRFVYDKVLPLVKEQSRILEYYLIQSLFENKDKEIIDELASFQNSDGGFGNGLEPDIRTPFSSVIATSVAIYILDSVRDESMKSQMIKGIVNYLENAYDKKRKRFIATPKEVNDHPRAIWWNHEDVEKNFPFGNPDPEIIGFLYENRKYLKKLDFSKLINQVVDYIHTKEFEKGGMHTLMSVMRFYTKVDEDVQNLIHDRIHEIASKEIDEGLGKWEEYSLEPYKLYIIEPHFVNTHLRDLGENLQYNLQKLESLKILPNWKWHQFDDVFEEVKYEWVGRMYYDIIKALRLHRNL